MVPEYFSITDDKYSGKFARVNNKCSYQVARRNMHTKIIGTLE